MAYNKYTMRTLLITMCLVLFSDIALAMPNPSSVFCEENGGKNVYTDIGIGICRFPDGSECEEWAFMSGQCSPGLFTDWIDENVSKKPELSLTATTGGYISNNKIPSNIISSPMVGDKRLLFSEKEQAHFYYMSLMVLSRNQNDRSEKSHPAKIIMKKNGVVKTVYPVKPINKGGNSSAFHIFIPVKEKGLYTFSLQTTGGDEQPHKKIQIFDNRNKTRLNKSKNQAKKMTAEEIRAMRLAEWMQKHPSKTLQKDKGEAPSSRAKNEKSH